MFEFDDKGHIDIDKSIRHLVKGIKDIELKDIGNDGAEIYGNTITAPTPLNINRYE